MAYKDRFGITDIKKGRHDNLSISWDYDSDPKKKRLPVLLYTPDMANTDEHFHIELNKKEAKALRDWLSAYLENAPTKGK